MVRCFHRVRSFTRFGLLMLATALTPLPASAVPWPGAAPCDTTLQACITGVAPGSVVELDDAVADENLSIQKSLTLRAAAGTIGVIGGGPSTRSISVGSSGPAVSVVIEDLTLDDAMISIDFFSGSAHQATVRNCAIRNEAESNNTRAVDIDLRVPASVTVEDNEIETNGNGIAVFTLLSSGDASALVQDNLITAVTPALSGNGLDVDLRGGGTVELDFFNNVIFGVAGCNCGGAAGIRVNLVDTVTATIDITHNTLDDLQIASPGVSVRTPDAGVSVGVRIFNNIVTRATEEPITLPAFSSTLDVSSGFNNFFNNASAPNYGGYPPGAGVIAVDPLFADPVLGDYHLDELSLAVDAGTSFPPGGLPTHDADGKPRVIGSNPDLGAYEVPEPGVPAAMVACIVALASVHRRRSGRL